VSVAWAGNVATLGLPGGRSLRITIPDDPAQDLSAESP